MAAISGKNVRLILDAVNNTRAHFDDVLRQINATNASTSQNTAVSQAATVAVAQLSANNNQLAAALLRTNQQLQQQAAAANAARAQLLAQRNATQAAAGASGALQQALFALKAAFAAMGVARFVEQLVDANIQFAKIQNAFEAVAGGPAGAAEEFKFVSAEAQRLGLYLPVVANEYTKLLAAGKPLGFQTSEIRRIFSSVTQAAVVLGLSMDDVHGTLRAVQQMMSKGTVQSEELRGQLGERLPGALALAAKAMGVTTQQLGKMLEQGQVLATDLLPKLATELEKTYGGQVAVAAEGTARQIDRLKTEYVLFLKELGDSGFIEAFVRSIASITAGLHNLTEAMSAVPGLGGDIAAALASFAGAAAVASVASLTTKLVGMAGGWAAVVAATGPIALLFAAAAGSIYQVIGAVGAFNEMMDQLDSARRMEEELIPGLNKDLLNAKEMASVLAVIRQARTQIAAEESKGRGTRKLDPFTGNSTYEGGADREKIAALEGIIFRAEKYGAAVVARNQKQEEDLRVQQEQTAELQKQVDLTQTRAATLAAASAAFKKQQLRGNDEENRDERIKILSADKAKLEKELAANIEKQNAGVNASDPVAARVGVATVFNALIAEELRIKTELDKTTKDLSAEEKARAAAIKKAVDEGINAAAARNAADEMERKAAQQAVEDKQRLVQLTAQQANEEQRAALARARSNIAADPLILGDDKRAASVLISQRENQLIKERIAFLQDELRLNATKPALDDKDRLQNLQNSITLQREINGLYVELDTNVRNTTASQLTMGQQLNVSMVEWYNSLGTTASQVANIMTTTLTTAIQSISQQLTDVIFQTTTWGDAFRNVVSAVVRGLVQMVIQFGLQQAAMFAIRQIYGKTSLIAAAAEAGSAAAIWAPAATAASIATFGGAAAAGLASFISSMAIGQSTAAAFSLGGAAGGFKEGGYTGDADPSAPAGIVHGREFVLPADVTARVGVGRLNQFMQDVRFGRQDLSAAPAASAAAGFVPQTVTAGASPNVTVNSQPNVVIFDDPRKFAQYLQSTEGEAAVFDLVSRRRRDLGIPT